MAQPSPAAPRPTARHQSLQLLGIISLAMGDCRDPQQPSGFMSTAGGLEAATLSFWSYSPAMLVQRPHSQPHRALPGFRQQQFLPHLCCTAEAWKVVGAEAQLTPRLMLLSAATGVTQTMLPGQHSCTLTTWPRYRICTLKHPPGAHHQPLQRIWMLHEVQGLARVRHYHS